MGSNSGSNSGLKENLEWAVRQTKNDNKGAYCYEL